MVITPLLSPSWGILPNLILQIRVSQSSSFLPSNLPQSTNRTLSKQGGPLPDSGLHETFLKQQRLTEMLGKEKWWWTGLPATLEMSSTLLDHPSHLPHLCPQSLQSCPTLCNPKDCSPPGPSVHGTLQARILEWVAMPSSRGCSQPKDQTHISCVSCVGRRVL